MSKLDKVTFTKLTPTAMKTRLFPNIHWLCGSKDVTVDAIGMGRSKLAAYRHYETQLEK